MRRRASAWRNTWTPPDTSHVVSASVGRLLQDLTLRSISDICGGHAAARSFASASPKKNAAPKGGGED